MPTCKHTYRSLALHFAEPNNKPLYDFPDFFNSYDADDTTVKPEPSIPDFQPEPVQVPVPPDNSALTSSTKQEPKDEESLSAPTQDEPVYGDDHNGDTGPSWNVGQANGGNSHQYNDTVMEQEPAPIGIKEDG